LCESFIGGGFACFGRLIGDEAFDRGLDPAFSENQADVPQEAGAVVFQLLGFP
jgi:hypothetical protein